MRLVLVESLFVPKANINDRAKDTETKRNVGNCVSHDTQNLKVCQYRMVLLRSGRNTASKIGVDAPS